MRVPAEPIGADGRVVAASRPDGRRAVLLLTAAIDVDPAMPQTQRRDPAMRRRDYEQALDFYVTVSPRHISDIVLCENTGADLKGFAPWHAQAAAMGIGLHLVGFRSTVPPRRGRGVAELEILDRGWSYLVDRFGPNTIVVKLTGRLVLSNVAALIESFPDNASVYFDARDVPLVGERLGGNRWVETRVMLYTLAGYRTHLYGLAGHSGVVIEKYLFQHLVPQLAVDRSLRPRFTVQPRFEGLAGSNQNSYGSVGYRAKDALRAVARRLAPRLWL